MSVILPPLIFDDSDRVMEQLIEFVGKHWWLVGIWGAFVGALLWDNNRRNGPTVSTAEATSMINKKDAFVLDIRDGSDFKNGHLVGAVNIPYANLANRLGELEPQKIAPLYWYAKPVRP